MPALFMTGPLVQVVCTGICVQPILGCVIRDAMATRSSTRPARGNNASTAQPRVGVIMGSASDGPTMRRAAEVLDALGIAFEMKVVSAHRTPDLMFHYAATAAARGLQVIIAGAGGAAHLPGMVAAKTHLPVLGVPVQSKALSGLDSLLSMAQMPGGVPVGTLAIGESGALNAGLLAAQILALNDDALSKRVLAWRAAQTKKTLESVPL